MGEGTAAAASTARRDDVPRPALALKEWGAVVHALLQRRQSILLRKGGIHERAFDVRGGHFVLFPTVEHSHHDRVRPEHADLLALGEGDVTADRLVIRCGVRLVDVVPVDRPDALADLVDLHIYSREHVGERFAFRPRHPLQVLVVQAVPLAAPITLAPRDEYGGCRSWLELPIDGDGSHADPPGDADGHSALARRVREALSVP